MKRFLVFILAALFILALFSGCGGNPAPAATDTPAPVVAQPTDSAPLPSATPEPTPEPDSPYNFAPGKFEADSRGFAKDFYEYELPISTTDEVLTMLTYSFTMQAYPEAGYATMKLPTQDREMTGVNIEYIITPVMTSYESFRVLIAADDLPDICSNAVLMYSGTPMEMIEDGYFANLYDYLDYIPNYTYMACNYDPTDVDMYESIFYYDDLIPAFYCIMQEPQRGAGYFMRGDWLEKFGLTNDDIVTWDDLHEALLLAKSQISTCEFPFVIRQTIDLVEGSNFMSYDTIPFIYDGAVGRNFVVDGQVKVSNMNDSDRELMKVLAGYYAEGLITPNWTSITRAVDSEAGITNNEYFYVSMGANESSFYEKSSSDPNCTWVPTTPPLRNEGQTVHLGGNISRLPAGNISVSAKCANIPLAVSWLDWRFSKTGGDLWCFGVEGETWELNSEGKRESTEFITNNPGGLSFGYLMLIYAINTRADAARTSAEAAFMYPGGEREFGYCQYWTNWLKTHHDGAYSYPVGARLSVDQTERINAYINDISTYMNENYSLFLDGSKNIDSDWDKYVEGLNQVGMQEYIDIYQEAYNNYISG